MDFGFGKLTRKELGELNPLVLAYIGDAVHELFIRRMLLTSTDTNARKLHSEAIGHVSAAAQSRSLEKVLPQLSEEELAVFKRGRNSRGASVPKNAQTLEYRRATGLETVFGYLYLLGDYERLVELLRKTAEAQKEDYIN